MKTPLEFNYRITIDLACSDYQAALIRTMVELTLPGGLNKENK